jgi:hypothetical protein
MIHNRKATLLKEKLRGVSWERPLPKQRSAMDQAKRCWHKNQREPTSNPPPHSHQELEEEEIEERLMWIQIQIQPPFYLPGET